MNPPSLLETIGNTRLIGACVVIAIYLAATIWFLRPLWRKKSLPANVANRSTTLVAFASQTGFAEQLAAQTAKSLSAVTPVRVASLADLDATDLPGIEQALFVVSTTGEGDAPDQIAKFVRDTLNGAVALPNLRYGVLALGDREYDNFCAFGHRLDGWLRHQGATPLFDLVEVDNGDEGALRHWQHQLSVLSDSPDLPDWETPRYERWRLIERHHVNPGSTGDPCFHIALQPCDGVNPQEGGANTQWSAGDIAEIDPQNSTWNEHAAEPLPHREYSIASLPADGAIHLLVRQMHRPGGEPGLGSGWLTQHAALGGEVALRIRGNSNFHAPTDSRPLILIGNGTGIAGLRALLKARIAAAHSRNWLIFGERSARTDRFYAEDIEQWQQQGWIETLDRVFSRDQPERRYVQHRLLECSTQLRAWVSDGASIYVCGSLKGMAPEVDAALTRILGADIMEQLAVDGRYRRDVY